MRNRTPLLDRRCGDRRVRVGDCGRSRHRPDAGDLARGAHRRGPRPERRGAIRISRAPTPTPTRTARRSSGRTSSPAASSRTSRATSSGRSSARRNSARSRPSRDPIHAPDNWWQDNLFLERGSQAWFVVDPEDGKIPPMTPRPGSASPLAPKSRKKSGRGPADSYEDRSLYDRCITRGLPGSMLPAIYGNQYQIVQAPGYVAILYEMIHETRVIPLDSPAGGRQADRARHGRRARPLGGRHARRRNDELQGAQRLSQRQPGDA